MCVTHVGLLSFFQNFVSGPSRHCLLHICLPQYWLIPLPSWFYLVGCDVCLCLFIFFIMWLFDVFTLKGSHFWMFFRWSILSILGKISERVPWCILKNQDCSVQVECVLEYLLMYVFLVYSNFSTECRFILSLFVRINVFHPSVYVYV